MTDNDRFLYAKLNSLPELNIDSAIDRTGSFGSYMHILTITAHMLPVTVKHLCNYYETDIDNYEIEIHGIKGVLRTLGADKLSDYAYELEKAAKNGAQDKPLFNEMHNEFISMINRFLAKLPEITDHDANAEKASGNKHVLVKTLSDIKHALQQYDNHRARELYDSVSHFTYSNDRDDQMRKLGLSLNSFDFEDALSIINSMIGDTQNDQNHL